MGYSSKPPYAFDGRKCRNNTPPTELPGNLFVMKIPLLIFASFSLLLYCLLIWLPPESSNIAGFLIISQILVLLYLCMLLFARRSEPFGKNRTLFLGLIILAVIIRITVLIGTEQSAYLSDDVYRYVWEGKLIVHGYNPFTTTPTSMAQSGMVDSTLYPHINHPGVPAISPPLSQYLFAVAYLIDNNTICGFKTLSFLFELFTLLAIILLLKYENKKRPVFGWQLLVYMFSPLVLIEFLISSHLDILAMPFFVISLYFLRKHNAVITGITLGLASTIIPFGFFFLPVLLFHFVKRDRVRFALSFVAAVIVLYIPFLSCSGDDVFRSFFISLSDWHFNGSLFQLLEYITGEQVAYFITGGIFLAVIVMASLLLRTRIPNPIERMFIVLGAYFILSPSVFPWYLIWTIPFLVLRMHLPFLILTGTVFLSYYGLMSYYKDGTWLHNGVLAAAVYVPFYTLLGYQLFTFIKQQRKSSNR